MYDGIDGPLLTGPFYLIKSNEFLSLRNKDDLCLSPEFRSTWRELHKMESTGLPHNLNQ